MGLYCRQARALAFGRRRTHRRIVFLCSFGPALPRRLRLLGPQLEDQSSNEIESIERPYRVVDLRNGPPSNMLDLSQLFAFHNLNSARTDRELQRFQQRVAQMILRAFVDNSRVEQRIAKVRVELILDRHGQRRGLAKSERIRLRRQR